LLDGASEALADGADVLLIGVLSSANELGLESARSLARPDPPAFGVGAAVSTALEELNRVRRESAQFELPPLVGVACNENDSDQLEHLIDALRVRLVVGPTDSERVAVAALRTQKRALLLPPFADGPELDADTFHDTSWVLSCRPNRRAVLGYFLNAVAEARRYIDAVVPRPPLNPALLVSADVATASFANELDGAALEAAGVRRLNYADMGGTDLVSDLVELEPPVDLVIAASMEDDWGSRMAAYDTAYFERHGEYPYYLLADKRAHVLEPTLADTIGAPPRALRFLGLDYERGALSHLALSAFAESYESKFARPAEPALEYAYDCTYVAVYSAMAAALRLRRPIAELDVDAIVSGVGALQGGSAPSLVGEGDAASVLAALVDARGRSGALDLVGASGALEFPPVDDPTAFEPTPRYVGVAAPNGELYCVDANTRSLCDTGIIFAADGGLPAAATDQCACLRAR
jgi:hypothetical protein